MDNVATSTDETGGFIGGPASLAGAHSFFTQYRRGDVGYDEVFGLASNDPRIEPRVVPHWNGLVNALGKMGAESFARRWDQAGQMLRENGIAYGSPGQATGLSRPWTPDPLPLVIPGDQWDTIGAALEQRAHLLSEVLADLFGPQRLLRDGLIPPEVLFRHPHFRRPLWSDAARTHSFLQLYAADIARDLNGNWWVVGDRTEAPSGLGFALENRLLISRIMPEPFHALHVKRLASFFIRLRETIASLAPRYAAHGGSNSEPRVVLLTRGEGSARYFEDAFLARYLGYTLATGQDLAVRGNRLMFKTLGGLLPVDVVLRRPDTSTLDPLEIVSFERNGTAGLLQALRLGHVGMVNPPGSGIVETPVLMSFLPQLCEQLLGEPLRMPAVATWWLGIEPQRRAILKRLDDVIIRPAFERPGPRVDREIQRLSSMSRLQLMETIAARPYDFVAQEHVTRSTIPVWDGTSKHGEGLQQGVFRTATTTLRVFQVRSADNSGYITMSGGLARVRCEGTSPNSSLEFEERCKDVWVLSDKPVRHVTLLGERTEHIQLRRGGAELPSRVADNLFWVGRHLERTEAVARLLRSVVLRFTGEEEAMLLPEMSLLLRAMAGQDQIDPDYAVPAMAGTLTPLDQFLPKLVFDSRHHGGLRARAETLVRTASTVRDRISFDSWRAIRKVGDAFEGMNPDSTTLTDCLEMAGETILSLAAFSGLASESMTRTPTWRFMDLGRRIERAAQSVAILHFACEATEKLTSPMFVALLENADSIMTYRSRYQSGFQLGPVCDLLMRDFSNPRAIAFQLVAISEHVKQLPNELHRNHDEHLQQMATQMLQLVESFDIASLEVDRPQRVLLPLLSQLEEYLPKFSDAINHRYFVLTPIARPLGGLEVSGEEMVHAIDLEIVDTDHRGFDGIDWERESS